MKQASNSNGSGDREDGSDGAGGGRGNNISGGSAPVASEGRTRRKGAEREISWIVVHCSAGVGRTGTFITILRAMHKLPFMQAIEDLSHMIDDTITHLRRSRLWMVKTDGEYATIFCALWHHLQAYGFDRPGWSNPNGVAEATPSSAAGSSSSGLVRSAQSAADVQKYRGVGFKRAKSGK